MADRIGVISKGEIILVEDKAELMRKLGKKQLTLQLQAPLDAIPDGAGRASAGAVGRRRASWSTPTTRRASAPASPRCCSDLDRAGHPRSRTCSTSQSSLEEIFVEPGERTAMNLHAIRAIYLFEMARTWRTLLQSIVSPVISTSLYFVVFGAAHRLAHRRRSTASATAPSSCPA